MRTASSALIALAFSASAAAADNLWSGLYVGGHAGYSISQRSFDLPAPFFPGDYTQDRNGFTGGALAGYNFQLGPWVLGAEFDATWLGEGPRQTVNMPASAIAWHTYSDIDLVASGRLRLGYTFLRYLNLYGTGGAAWMRGSANLVVTDGAATVGQSSTSADHFGWVAGAGIEWLATNNIALRFEYLHHDFGRADYNYAGAQTSADLTIDTVRGALLFKF
jgi:opacity protein-like surface antigen